MQTKMEIADAFCKAVDIIVDKKLEKLAFNSTIVGEIEKESDSLDEYSIKYQNTTFIARPIDRSKTYSVGQYVYILVPNNAENRTRYILGLVQSTARNLSIEDRISALEAEVLRLQTQIIQLGGK